MKVKTKALYEATERKDVKEIVYHIAKEYNENTAFVIKNKIDGHVKYTNISYKQLLEDINGFGTELYSMGLQGKRIAIIGKNRYEWVLTHLTNLLGGMVSVPLDKDLPLEELESSLIRSKADVIVFDPKLQENLQKIKENGKTNLKEYICMEKLNGYKNVVDLMEEGKKKVDSGNTKYIDYKVDENAMNILLFTSGTTAKSKAVMLSHRNIASNVYALQCVEDIRPTDTNIAFLPFHHIFGSTCIIWTLACGLKNVFPDGLRYIKQNLNEYKVTIFVGVPLLVESIYKTIMKEVEKQGKTKLIKNAIKVSNFLLKLHIDVRRKLFKQILDALGGELRFVVSGGAPADPIISKGFNDFGIETVQGYGLSETAPVIAGEDREHLKPGTVGIPMINDTIEIVNKDEDGIGEIRVKGPNVMLGYYEMPEETSKVLKDGWFYTGDLGYFDDEGYLTLTGRNKDMIVLKNGKKVFPEEIETYINRIDLVSECMVFGLPDKKDKRNIKLSVKVVYDEETIKEKYSEKTEEDIYNILWEKIKETNNSFPKYKHIQKLIVSHTELIKTTTKKVKRQEEMKVIQKELN
ncbi:MAG: AMP-binding protein [Clostridia bacterium]|nr:AMP-binding protein [Clostridia bacterium]